MARVGSWKVLGLLVLMAGIAQAESPFGLKAGHAELKSAGVLTFGPHGVLFVADPQQAAIFAIDTQDQQGDLSAARVEVDGINEKLASMLGVEPRDVLINDVAVNPLSGNVYLSVSRGRGPDAQPVIVKVSAEGKLSDVSLKNVPFAKTSLPNAPADQVTGEGNRRQNPRTQSITDLAFIDGRLFVAGLSNEEFASKLRAIPFPFQEANQGTSVEIFHGAHGKFETRSPIRTFVAYEIGGDPHLLAAYTCTPLVKFRVSDLTPGKKLQGVTLAELGNRNNPLDIIVYQQAGRDFLLIANSSRGVMKVSTEEIGKQEGITEPVTGGGTAGLKYETISTLKGVVQLDKLNAKSAVVLVVDEAGRASLKTIELP
jgi:hypothetical protein